MSEIVLEEVKRLAIQLAPPERAQLALWLDATLRASPERLLVPAVRSLYGAFADLGHAPTDAEIDEARRKLWANFPREDIA